METVTRVLLAGLLLMWFTTQAGEVSPEQAAKLQARIMNANLPLQNRVRALKKLHADQIVNGKINRSFCVWDPLGRNGPIYATVNDQKLRSLHYGLALDIRAYPDEEQLIADLKSGVCDAALIRGNRTYEFNRYVATLEAPGAVPDVQHFRILSQVIASPKMAGKMEQGDYVVAGVAYLGDSYFVRHPRSLQSLAALGQQKLGVIRDERSLVEVANRLSANAVKLGAVAAAGEFVAGGLDVILAPAVIYQALIAGQLNGPVRILDMPQSLSTIQLIGRQEKFPTGLAQILREDFLFKFDTYVGRVEAEMNTVPADYWQVVPESEQQRHRSQLQSLRLSLRKQGLYDGDMLALMRKVRCKLAPQAAECTAVVE